MSIELTDPTPPQAIEVEEQILGTILLDSEEIDTVVNLLLEKDFYGPAHQYIFRAIKSLWSNTRPVDVITVGSLLEDKNKLDESGGHDYLADLTKYAGASNNIVYYCQILKNLAMKRQVILLCSDCMKDAYNGIDDAFQIVDKLSSGVDTIGVQSVEKKSFSPSEIFEREKDNPKAEKLYTGIRALDEGIYAEGFRKGQVNLTIADSGHGKTQWAMFIAERFLENGYKPHWFQLEGYDIDTAEYMKGLQQMDNIRICDNLYDIEDIKREARIVKKELGTDVIFFDYVQNMECSKNIQKAETVEYISKQITKLAKELHVLCFPLSQVTMNYTSRSGWAQEPTYGDVRWSQQLKQDASVITGVFRPNMVQSLIVGNGEGVKDWKDNVVPYESVFTRQVKVRHAKKEWKRMHMIHVDSKLKPYAKPAPF